MSVSVPDTKVLWGRAAGRCSRCRIKLTAEVEEATATIPLGEQAHIVAEEEGGPRGDSSLAREQRNSYPNLILLCPNCHTLVDKTPNDFPSGLLHILKRDHETWVDSSGLRTNSDPRDFDHWRPSPHFLLLGIAIVTLSVVSASAGHRLIALCLPLPIVIVSYFRHRHSPPLFGSRSIVEFMATITIYCASTIYLLPAGSFIFALGQRVNSRFFDFGNTVLVGQVTLHLALCFLIFLGAVIVEFITRHLAISGSQTNPFAGVSNIDRADFPHALQRYCDALVADLDRYDREVNWSDRELTPLEAEVETEYSSPSRARIVRDLVEGIRSDRRSSGFMVLGDPGSGKSVSLRRLVRILARQAGTSGIVPVYVNLREYPINEEPTPETILGFVRNVTSRQTGRDGRAFLDTWYERFRKTGRLFFVIDSFDELPAVLDCDDKSESHRRISCAFDRFFTQEVLSCRAVLASRHFRAPVYVSGTRLVIRPFTESQIRSALRIWLQGKGVDSGVYVRGLFQQRAHLAPLLRNPFTAELIAEYAIAGGGHQLPETMFSVFDHYVSRRLAGDETMLARLKITNKDVRKGAGLVAVAMYENSQTFGLEADVDEIVPLIASACGASSATIIEALAYCRLARVGGSARRRFSFVHRRFAEFFVVDAMNRDGGRVELTSIPTDSRWRDCLVLCCGILDAPRRAQVANYCWAVIKGTTFTLTKANLEQLRAAVHCARFLSDAFRGDTAALGEFDDALGKVALRLLDSKDLLIAKIGAELIPLLPPARQQEAIIAALNLRSRWISNITLSSCRHLGALDDGTSAALRSHFRSMPITELFGCFRDIDFSLSLSDAFRSQRRALRMDIAEISYRTVLTIAFGTLALIGAPGLFVPLFGVALLGWLLHSFLEERMELHPSRLVKPYHGVIGFRDAIDAWSHLLVLGLPAIYFIACGGRPGSEPNLVGEFLSKMLGFANAPILKPHPAVQAIVLAVGVLAYCKWERFAKHARQSPKPKEEAPRIEVVQSADERKATVEKKREEKKAATVFVVTMVLPTICGFITVIGGLIWLWSILDDETKWKVKVVLACILVTFLAWIVLRSGVRAGQFALTRTRERRRLASLGIPPVISCEELYNNLSTFTLASVGSEYVRALRVRRVGLVGDVKEPPRSLLRGTLLAEELAILREQWLGLDR